MNKLLLILILVLLIQISSTLSLEQSSSSSSDNGWVEPPACGDLSICLYTEVNYKGKKFEFSVYNGYIDLPDFIKRNITSFVANAEVCFLSFSPNYYVQQIPNGSFLSNYWIVFGNLVDSIKAGSC